MENEVKKPEYKPVSKSYLPILFAVIIYVAVMFLFSSFFILIVLKVLANNNNLDYSHIVKYATGVEGEYTDLEKSLYQQATGYGNFISYFVMLIGVSICMRKFFVEDIKLTKENKRFYSVYIGVAAIAFVFLTYLCDIIISFLLQSIGSATESANQSTIVAILKSNACIPMVISTVIFAPIVEELIYRKAVFEVFNAKRDKKGLILSYIVSIICFAIPHMISTSTDILTWMIQALSYVISGALLCVVYHKGKFNIYTSITAHMLNNLFAVLLVFIQKG